MAFFFFLLFTVEEKLSSIGHVTHCVRLKHRHKTQTRLFALRAHTQKRKSKMLRVARKFANTTSSLVRAFVFSPSLENAFLSFFFFPSRPPSRNAGSKENGRENFQSTAPARFWFFFFAVLGVVRTQNRSLARFCFLSSSSREGWR